MAYLHFKYWATKDTLLLLLVSGPVLININPISVPLMHFWDEEWPDNGLVMKNSVDYWANKMHPGGRWICATTSNTVHLRNWHLFLIWIHGQNCRDQFAAITDTIIHISKTSSLVRLCYYCYHSVKQKQLEDPKTIFTSSDVEKDSRLEQDKQIL